MVLSCSRVVDLLQWCLQGEKTHQSLTADVDGNESGGRDSMRCINMINGAHL